MGVLYLCFTFFNFKESAHKQFEEFTNFMDTNDPFFKLLLSRWTW